MSLNTVFTDHRCTYIVSTGGDGGHESKYSVYRSSLLYLHSGHRGRDGGHECFTNTVFKDHRCTLHSVVVRT